MSRLAAVDAAHVRQAVHEYDELGADAFLRRHGFDKALQHVLWHEGKGYDSKAIVGVAHRYATGTPLRAADFSGGRDGAARHLWSLGFEVVPERDDTDLLPPPGGEWRDVADVGVDRARQIWAEHARDVLLEVATHYHTTVTYRELAGLVQARSGIRTRKLVHYWIGDVLHLVARGCAERGEPLLSALCVNSSGSVGEAYVKSVVELRGELAGDGDEQAAVERLACHRHAGAAMPADGGRPALTPQLATTRTRERRAALADRPALVCAACNMALPASGDCDGCG